MPKQISESYVQFESLYPQDSWFAQIDQILKFVKEGKSCQLIGAPGVGKYAIFGLLVYNHNVRVRHLGEKQQSYHFVHLDFSEVRKRPLSDVMKMLFLALTDSLRDRKLFDEYTVVNEMLRNALSMQDELVMREELKHAIEILVYEHQLNVIYLFERFEEYVPTLTSEFFSNLRIIRNKAKYHFSVVFSVHKPLEELVEPIVLADFHDLMAGNIIYVPLYDKESVVFRIKHLENVAGKKVPQNIAERLLKLTGGHGKLMRMATEAFLVHGEAKDYATFLLAQKTVTQALAEIWLSLSPVEQQALRPVPDGTGLRSPDASPVAQYLAHIGLLKDGKSTIPLLEAYISSAPGTGAQKIVYDEKTNTISKGSLTLSDGLTSSEFLLLRYLVLHPEQIIMRDELINVVWGDNRSTAGVTDQALDQLIFRVRKKIEENPNEPAHVQTVKGRGIRFTP